MTKEDLDRALELLADAKRQLDRCDYRTPEGVAIVEHYMAEVTVRRAMARSGVTSLEECKKTAGEVEEALLLYDASRYVKCQDDPHYRRLLEFYRTQVKDRR